jgi:hypothetical protein
MKKMPVYFLMITIFSAFSLPPLVIAQDSTTTLHFDLGENTSWAPYRIGKTPGQDGILSELVVLIEKYSGITFTAVNWPMKRAEFALIKGLVDFDFICTAWFPGGTYGRNFVISEPLFEINEYVITLKGNKHLFPTLDSIYTKPIGTIAGYFYFDDYQFTRVDFSDEESLIKALKYKRVQAVILEYEAAKHWAEVHQMDIEIAALHTTGNLLIRLNKAKQQQLPAINAAIKKIKQTGQLKEILDKYDVESQIF